jgi:glycosyltransferase involved in cell wall biosynthesis
VHLWQFENITCFEELCIANKIDISVVIASYNSAPLVFETLESLRRQEGIKPCEYEVILADSSNDGTNDAVHKRFPDVKVIHADERKFPGAARNMGIRESSGAIIAFIDADAVASTSWLERIRHHHQNPGNTAVGGPILNGNPQKFLGWVPYWCEFTGYTARSPETRRRVIPTCNMSIKRKAFDEYGPFLEEQFGNEDVLLAENLRKAGLGPVFKRDMTVYHFNRYNWPRITAHLRNLGMSTGAARRKYNVAGAASFRSWKRHIIIPLTPLYKAALIWGRVVRDEPERLLRLAATSPWIIAGLIHWTIGMRNGLRQGK